MSLPRNVCSPLDEYSDGQVVVLMGLGLVFLLPAMLVRKTCHRLWRALPSGGTIQLLGSGPDLTDKV